RYHHQIIGKEAKVTECAVASEGGGGSGSGGGPSGSGGGATAPTIKNDADFAGGDKGKYTEVFGGLHHTDAHWSQATNVFGDQKTNVKPPDSGGPGDGSQHTTVAKDQTEKVGGDKKTDVHGSEYKTIDGNSIETISGEKLETIDGQSIGTIGGDKIETVVGAEISTVGGEKMDVIAGVSSKAYLAFFAETVNAAKTTKAPVKLHHGFEFFGKP
ncbi:MAG TPA: hypothetical protein PK867_06900, partial [Pirellulales bacterium]|nr:hypothetical protein [Pirellulales bacterium]